jgi:hypothetical protein
MILPLFMLLAQIQGAPANGTADIHAPVMVELSVLLRWVILPGAVAAFFAFLAIASFDRFLARRLRAKESGSADLLRELLGAPDQRRATATLILDMLGERHEETKGFINRLYSEEIRERSTVYQLAKGAHDMSSANGDAITALRQGLLQQGESLRILPQLEKTFTRFESAVETLNASLREISDRLSRMEGAMERDWDGLERRRRPRGSGE